MNLDHGTVELDHGTVELDHGTVVETCCICLSNAGLWLATAVPGEGDGSN